MMAEKTIVSRKKFAQGGGHIWYEITYSDNTYAIEHYIGSKFQSRVNAQKPENTTNRRPEATTSSAGGGLVYVTNPNGDIFLEQDQGYKGVRSWLVKRGKLETSPSSAQAPYKTTGQQYLDLRNRLADLLAIKPDSKGRYSVDGKLLTKTGWQKEVDKVRSKISDAELKAAPPAASTEAEAAAQRDLRLAQSEQLQMMLADIQKQISTLTNVSNTVVTATEQDNVNTWIAFYKSKETELNNAISQLGQGINIAVVPVAPQIVDSETARTTAYGQTVQKPGAAATTQTVAPTTTTPATAPTTTTPVGAPTTAAPTTAAPTTAAPTTAAPTTAGPTTTAAGAPTTPATTGAPTATRPTRGVGMTAAQAQGKFSDLRPGVKTGDIVGGPDRILDNGGSVVAGRYIAPGFSVGGITSSQNMTGGGTGGTGTGFAPVDGGVTPDAGVPTDWETAAQEIYGGYYAIVKSIPEIATLLQNAVANGWSDGKFDYELKQTNWFKTTSESARQWDISKQTDPAAAQQQIDIRVAGIKDKALTLGVRLSDTSASTLAEASIRGGWSEQLLDNAIGSEAIKSTAGVSQLRTGYIGQTLRQTASNYGVNLSDTTFNEWVNKVAVGQENEQSFQQYALQIAKGLYPGIATQLENGQTYQQIVDPYRQLAGRTLEMNADTIDFTDPKWARAVTHTTDKGEQRPMNYNEWASYLRQDRSFGYEFTTAARQQAYQISNDLANLFGKV